MSMRKIAEANLLNETFDVNATGGGKISTGLSAYSDSVRTAKKGHCKRGASYFVTVSKPFYCVKVRLGAQKSVTVRGELLTVSL